MTSDMNTTKPTVITMAGRFDVHRLGELRAAARHADAIVIDVSETEFFDVHALDAVEDLSRARHGAVALAGPSLLLRITLEITGRHLSHYPDIDAAAKHTALMAGAAA